VWLQQLIFLKPTLLAKLNEQAGSEAITDLAFRVGEIPETCATATGPLPERTDVTEAAQIEADAHADAVQDPELRQRLASLMAAAFSRARIKDGGPPAP
jgi:hypothetical protein